MKNAITLFLIILIIPVFGFTQSIENLDYISPFHDGIATIKKGNQWAFINQKGNIIIDFRNDLVSSKSSDGNYPIFNNDRCLIVKEIEGISYFGYIDKFGKSVVEPQFLNATIFNNENAIALKLVKENVGENKALGKKIVYYKYYEIIIDANGQTLKYLTQDGVNVVLDKKFLRKPPKIESKLISDTLFAKKDKNGKWAIIHLNQ